MTRQQGRPASRSSRVQTVGWWTPPANPPVIAENKWRLARLKVNVAAAGDSGAIENITPARVFEILKAQQGVDITPALASVRICGVFSYALAGVADGGAQVYPSTKLRVYTPKEDNSQGVLIAQREDSGTLDSGSDWLQVPRVSSERGLEWCFNCILCPGRELPCCKGLHIRGLFLDSEPQLIT